MAPQLGDGDDKPQTATTTTTDTTTDTTTTDTTTTTNGIHLTKSTVDTPSQPNPPLSTCTPNPALHTSPAHDYYLSPSPPLDPSPTQCVVRVHCSGICGSDLHLTHSGAIGSLRVTGPHCLGHESAGRVAWVGSRVTNVRIGDRVAIEPGVPCHGGSCLHCQTGEYNLCPDVRFAGVPPHPGFIRRWGVHEAIYLHKLPDELGYDDGALLEPLSVALHAFERGPVRLAEPVLVAGAGPIGLMVAKGARASGCWPIVVTDVDEERLRFARAFVEGCRTLRVELGQAEEEIARRVGEELRALGCPQPRISFECVGRQESVSACLHATRRGGEVVVVGVGREKMDALPFMHASMAEIDLKFINRYHHAWPYAIRLLQSGYLDLKGMVTHKFPLEQAVEALATASDRSKASIKVHIMDPDPQEGEANPGYPAPHNNNNPSRA